MTLERPTPSDIDRRQWLAWAAALPLLPACIGPARMPAEAEAPADPAAAINDSDWARAHKLPGISSRWQHRTFPNRHPVRYEPVADWHGKPALRATAQRANSLVHLPLRHPVRPQTRWAFSWWASSLNPQTDITDPSRNDVTLRWTLTFDGDRAAFSRRDHMLSELALLMTGEPLPHATLMYVWDPVHPAGSILPHPHTARIRHLVVQSGTEGLQRWQHHERDLFADFEAAFGETPGALLGIGAFTNSNNTGHPTQAWYGPVALS